jgi:hypothetical protein
LTLFNFYVKSGPGGIDLTNVKAFFEKHTEKHIPFIEKHSKFFAGSAIILLMLAIFALLAGALYFVDKDLEKDHQAALNEEIAKGLSMPMLQDVGNNKQSERSTVIETKIYTVLDKELGYELTLVVSNYGYNPPTGITKKRIKDTKAIPANGFKQISGLFTSDQRQISTVWRYTNVSENKFFYYVWGENSVCPFSLNESTPLT